MKKLLPVIIVVIVVIVVIIVLLISSCNLLMWETITFESNGGTLVEDQLLLDGSVIAKPANPTKSGYTFGGWYSDTELTASWDFDTLIEKQTTLYAKWTLTDYTITYFLDGGINDSSNPSSYTLETENVTLKNPTKAGFAFLGWYAENSFETQIIQISQENISLYAKWTANMDTAYTVKHYQQDITGTGYTLFDTDSLTGTTDTEAEAVPKAYAGFTENTFHSSRLPTGTIAGDGSLVLNFYYDRNTYTVSFGSDGGTDVTPITGVRYGATITVPTVPTKTGYTIVNWFKESSNTIWEFTTDTVFENMTLYAKWTANINTTYTVKHYQQDISGTGYTLSDTDSLTGTTDTEAAAVSKVYTCFTENTIHSSRVSMGTITGDGTLELKLYYDRTTHTVSFDSDGGTMIPPITGVRYGAIITAPIDPEKEGYTFGGWYHKSSLTTAWEYPIDTVTTDQTLYAKWILIDYSISYYLDGGTNDTSNPNSYTIESEATALANPSKTGFTFLGWFKSFESTTQELLIPTESIGEINLYAKWDAIFYRLKFNANGGSEPPYYLPYSAKMGFEKKLFKPDWNYIGHTFIGWADSAAGPVDYTAGDTFIMGAADTTLYAQWDPLNYSITYQLNGGENSDSNPDSYTVNSESITLEEPTRTHYNFLGWYNSSQATDPIEQILSGTTGSITLGARWQPISYTIAYNLNGGMQNSSNPDSYSYSTNPIILENPSKAGYSFSGWFAGEDSDIPVTQIAAGSTENISLEARWQVVDYTIDYALNGGTGSTPNPDSYTIESETITFSSPTRTGYTFLGWFSSSASLTPCTQIAIGSTGVLSLEARWKVVDYTITYVLNGGTNNTLNPDSYTIESETITFSSPTRTGYTFLGWFISPDLTTLTMGIPSGSIGAISLSARWEVINYGITYNLNGGTNNSSNSNTYTAEAGTITLSDPERGGYTFQGWVLTNDIGTNISTIQLNTFVDSDNIKLTATWSINTYTVTYHANGATEGSIPESQSGTYGSTITIAPTPIEDGLAHKVGYMTGHWNTKPDGSGTRYWSEYWGATPDTFTLTEDLDLYREFVPLPHDLIFNANGGTGTMETLKVKSDETITLPDNEFLSVHHSFEGWATSPTGPVVYDNGSEYTMVPHPIIGTDVTLYAKWKAYEVGDSLPFSGVIIFYDKGSVSDGWRYLGIWPDDETFSGSPFMSYEQAKNKEYYHSRLPTREEFQQIETTLYNNGLGNLDGSYHYWTLETYQHDFYPSGYVSLLGNEEKEGTWQYRFSDTIQQTKKAGYGYNVVTGHDFWGNPTFVWSQKLRSEYSGRCRLLIYL